MVWTDFKFSLIKHAQDLWWLFDYCMLAYEHLRTLGTRWQLNIVLLVVCKCKIKEFNIWIKKYIYRADAGIVQNDEIINSYILHKGFIKHAISLINTPTARPISHHPWGWEYSRGKVGDGGVKRWTGCSKTLYGLLKNNLYNAYMYMHVLIAYSILQNVSRALMIARRVLPRGSVHFGIHVNNKTRNIYDVK